MHLARALREAGDALAHFPYRGRQVTGTRMREIVITYPYALRYRVEADEVIILSVRHTSRRPANP